MLKKLEHLRRSNAIFSSNKKKHSNFVTHLIIETSLIEFKDKWKVILSHQVKNYEM